MPYITTAERLGFQRGIQEGIEKGMEKGHKEGIEKGELLLIQRQLARKFGEIPLQYCQRLQQSSADELLNIADRILDAKTLEDVFL